jgi:hypothetical protein
MLELLFDFHPAVGNSLSNPDARSAYWLQYLNSASVDYLYTDVNQPGDNNVYIITMNFWNFTKDHFNYIPDQVLELVRSGQCKIVFWYSEADSPREIRQHICVMCERHRIDSNLVWLVSANSSADQVANCRFFFDDNVLYWHLTRLADTVDILDKDQNQLYTCLVRTHKTWRSEFVYNLMNSLPYGLTSYHGVGNLDTRDDFGIINEPFLQHQSKGIVTVPDQWWLNKAVRADNLDSSSANDHSIIVKEHYRPYINVSLETLLEADGQEAVFVTEKTIKPIRNGQMFMVLGCPGTLRFLRKFGYKTFAPYIDESYDNEPDVRLRWYKVFDQLRYIHDRGPQYWDDLWHKCLPTIIHNQVVFNRGMHDYIKNFFSTL